MTKSRYSAFVTGSVRIAKAAMDAGAALPSAGSTLLKIAVGSGR